MATDKKVKTSISLEKPIALEGLPIPEAFCCPITTLIMKDPVITDDGQTYERQAIERWFRKKEAAPQLGRHLKIQN
ncbi:MAG: U-box domain-containing protein [Gammaproteobacteria bacterium]